MNAIVSRISIVRIAAVLLALAVLATMPGFTGSASAEEVYVEDVIAQAVSDLDEIWADVLADYGIEYVMPEVVIYTDDVDTSCGYLVSGENYGMFCGWDYTIYIDAASMVDLASDYGFFAVAVAVADIWGYTVQDHFGTTAVMDFQDVQASCLAGAWAWYVWDNGWVSDEVLYEGLGYYETLEDGDFYADVFLYGLETDSVADCLELVD